MTDSLTKVRREPPRAAVQLLEPLESRRLLAGDFLADLNPATGSASPSTKVDMGSYVLFWSDTALWRSDGTEAGTTRVRGAFAGEPNGGAMARLGDTAYFFARETYNGPYAFWKTDGTPEGTAKISDQPGGTPYVCDDEVYFSNFAGSKAQLWRSDGTAGGTTLVKEFDNNPYQPPRAMTYFNGYVYFVGGSGYDQELWRTDGTATGTTLVKDIYTGTSNGSSIGSLSVANGLLYFAASAPSMGIEPWRSDGTDAGTYMLRNVASTSSSSWPRDFVALDAATTLFVADGYLYRTNGTTTGTTRVTPLGTDAPYSFGALVKAGNTVYTSATQYYSGSELWKTDGTNAGTVRVKDINAGGYGSHPASLTAVGSTLYFSASDELGTGGQLWKSDGSEAGTVKVKSLPEVSSLFASGGRVFFTGDDGVLGRELYVSDGTAPGTHITRDVNGTPFSSNPGGNYPASYYWATRGTATQATLPGGVTLFAANGGLWRTDGTASGTKLVEDLPRYHSSLADVSHMTVWNGAAYFSVDASSNGGVWRSDGTPEGTYLLKAVELRSSTSRTPFVPFKDALYFFANGGNTGQLYKTDGTPEGTVDALAGSTVSLVYPDQLAAAGDHLFFRAGWDEELWVSDGTAVGTKQLKDINPGSSNTGQRSTPDELVAMGDTLYFTAQDTSNSYDRGLWKSDGTPEGTVPVMRGIAPTYPGTSAYERAFLTPVGDTLYFAGFTWGGAWELWKSDGTTAGTGIVREIGAGEQSGSPKWLTYVNGLLYFGASTPETGVELWRSDGTAAGTRLVHDLNPGPAGSLMPADASYEWAEWPILADGAGANGVFVVGDDGVHGRELFHATGRPGDMTLVADANPGAAHGNPRAMAVASAAGEPSLIFSAYDPVHGRELWRADVPEPIDPTPPTVTDVFVAGSAWAGLFKGHLGTRGLGDATYGYRIPAADQLNELPWTNLNRVSVRFSEPVDVSADDLVIRGVNVAVYGATMAYDAATFTATWSLPVGSFFAVDKLLLDLDAEGVADASGNALDGEWPGAAAAGAYPSGDGTAGGDFRFRLNVLPGDVNGTGSILGSDVTLVRNAQGTEPGFGLYTIFKDVNGTGSILGSDVTLVRNRQGISLPDPEPVAPASVEGSSIARMAAAPTRTTATRSSPFATGSKVRSAMQLLGQPFDPLGDEVDDLLRV